MTTTNRQLPPPLLCRPADDLACCGCCPPIRPPGFDHLNNKTDLTAQLKANTENFYQGRLGAEIDGRSCWGLGFLDNNHRLIGCLLHPARNRGRDLRGPTGYRDKCDRETCPQFKTFAALAPEQRARAINLVRRSGAAGDSFRFSSSKANPLWSLLAWGAEVLEATEPWWDREDSALFSYLTGCHRPRAMAWPLVRTAGTKGSDWLNDRTNQARLELAVARLAARLGPFPASPLANEPFVHRLGLEPLKADFIRLGLGLARLNRQRAAELAARLEKAVPGLMAELKSAQPSR